MLIIPLEGKLSLRNPPVATLLLIAASCLVFFVFQSEDDSRFKQAYHYYFESGLAGIELPLYAKYLESEKGNRPEIGELDRINSKAFELLIDMQQNDGFMSALHHEKIIVPGSAVYNPWRNKRTEFNNRLNRTTLHRYGLVPAQVKPWMFVTMMFIHGDAWHLLGNMVFLWIVGCVLEMGLGRLLYCGLYILGGIFAAVFYYTVHYNSFVPGIGASGAISALMGAMTVLYGFTRIRVFFSTGFYFDYFRIPAVLLLPIWLGKEVLAFFFGASAGVAYMAHAGGLIGGVILGGGCRQLLGSAARSFFEETPQDPVPEMLEDASDKISRLDFEGARHVLQEILSFHPLNEKALELLFNVEKQDPDTPQFHDAARRYLSALTTGSPDPEKTYRICSEYESLAGRSALPDDLYARLANIFLESGRIKLGKKITVYLIRTRPGMEAVPALLLRLIRALESHKEVEKAEKYKRILSGRYPDSPEARIAKADHPQR